MRFHESDVREMGRDTTGVKGIELRPEDQLVGMVVIKREATLLVVTFFPRAKFGPRPTTRMILTVETTSVTVTSTVTSR